MTEEEKPDKWHKKGIVNGQEVEIWVVSVKDAVPVLTPQQEAMHPFLRGRQLTKDGRNVSKEAEDPT